MKIGRELIPALALGCLGAAAVLLATVRGIGVSPDSMAYLSAARSIASGNGVNAIDAGRWQPLTHFPPLLPLVAAAGALIGMDPAGWLRILHALLLAVLAVSAASLVRRATGGGWLAASLTAGALVTSPDLVTVFSMAWSEPLFLVILLCFLAVLARHVAGEERTSLLVACGLLAAAGVLTRYAGLSLIAMGVVAILLAPGRPRMRRIRDGAIFLAVALAPLLAWGVRNALLAGNVTSRPLRLHLLPWDAYIGGAIAIRDYLTHGRNWLVLGYVPFNAQLLTAVVFGGLLIIAGLAGWRIIARSRGDAVAPLVALFAFAYLGTLCVAGAFQDRSIHFDARHFIPLLVCGVILVVTLFLRATDHRRGLRLAVIGIAVVHIAVGAAVVGRWVVEARREGLGYNARSWTESRLIERVRRLPETTPVLSNADDAVYYLTGRRAASLPFRFEPVSGTANQQFPAEVRALPQRLGGDGVLVYFDTVPWRTYLPTRQELSAPGGLREIARETDGSLYASPLIRRAP